MKIAFLSMYSGLVDRGVETFVHELAQRLSTKYGHEVTVFQAGEARGNEDYKVEKINLRIDWSRKDLFWLLGPLNYWNRLLLRFTLRAIPILGREKFDIIIPLNNSWQRLLVRILSFIRGSKMVISAQSGPGLEDRLNLYFFPHAFVAFTEHQCNWARRINRLVKVFKIPNGVDLQKFKPEGLVLKTSLKRPTVLFVGALEPTKRPIEVIEAVARLKDVSLLVVGDGPMRNEVKGLGEKLLPGRFALTRLPHNEMPKVYRAANVFTFPTSPWESFGIVMLEAMATNLPVVASNDPIRQEIVGDAGIFVDPENTIQYARALDKALSTTWKDRPREQAKKFSWDSIAEQYDKLFKEL